jgi:predicted phosphodiesterase
MVKTRRKNAIVIVALLLFIGSSFTISKQTTPIQPKIVIGPYTQNVTQTSITIIWETDIPTATNLVEYGETVSYGYMKNGDAGISHHEITITCDFPMGHYKVISDNQESKDYEFSLISSSLEQFTFVVFGDSRSNRDIRRMVSNQVNTESPDFVIHSGDMVDNGNSWSEWQKWLADSMPLLQNSTMFGTRGNHEEDGEYYSRVFTPPIDKDCWYSFDYGPCHFVIIDDNVPYEEESDQYHWLETDLSFTEKPYKIAVQHEGMYCAGGHNSNMNLRQSLEPLFNQYGVQIVFSGHNHFYQRTEEINGTIYITTAGAGAPLYTPGDAWFVNYSKKAYHYCAVNISSITGTMHISARYGNNGTQFDEYLLCPKFSVQIKKPQRALYVCNMKIIPLLFPVIIGKIDIEVGVRDYQSDVQRVEFFIDNELKETDTVLPYTWTWDEKDFFFHTIKVTAFDNTGNSASDKLQIFKLY